MVPSSCSHDHYHLFVSLGVASVLLLLLLHVLCRSHHHTVVTFRVHTVYTFTFFPFSGSGHLITGMIKKVKEVMDKLMVYHSLTGVELDLLQMPL